MDASITKSASLSNSPFSESNKNSNYQSKSKKTKKKKKNIDYVSDSNSYTNKSQVSKEDEENDYESKSVNNIKPKGKTVRSSSQHYSGEDSKKIQSDLHDSSLSISPFSASSSKYEEKKKSSKKSKQEKNTTNNKKKNKNKGKKKKYKNSYSRSSSQSYIDSFSSDVSDLKRKGNNKKRKKSLSVSSSRYMRYDKYDNKKKKNTKSKDEYKKKSDKKKNKKKNDYDKLSSISLSSFYTDVTSYSDKYEATSKGKSKKKDKNKKSEKNNKLEKREKATDKDKYYGTRKRYSDSYTTSIDSLKSVSFEKKKKKSEKKYDKKKYNRGGYSSSERRFYTSDEDTQNEGRGYRDRYFRNRDIREDKKYEKKRKYGEKDKYEKKYKNDNKYLINKYGKRKYSTSRSLSYSNRYSIESKNYKGKRRSFSNDILDRSDISTYYSRRGGIKKIRKKKNINNMNIITSSHSFSDNSINYRFKRDASQEIFWKKNRNVYRYNDNISIKYEGKKKNYERVHNYNNTSFEMLGVQLRHNKNYNENGDKLFGMTKYDSNNNISNRTNDIIGIINREKTCPFLLRLFYKTNVEYISVDDIDLNKSGVNNNELQIYAWIDITMREIVTLVKDFYKEGRKRNAQWIFNGYSCESKKINFLSKVHSIKHNYKEDNKTLLSLNYEIGDIILLSIMFDT
ncbi:histone deacetylase complex subunit SAP18, putative [Plasmodium vinckei brucechwatti]|uniref:Histone deacetylase complex subunit SAP18, putative n=1 Tax=Plasmodium vinckei brucechwatti TaxID=119398 RepID=A0A6V7SHG3_PLAVN|nr:histone deacetylase complex subunit SAP18, putative [Plasmodium vinckei brucechwatti]